MSCGNRCRSLDILSCGNRCRSLDNWSCGNRCRNLDIWSCGNRQLEAECIGTVIAFTLFRVLTDYWTASIIVSICVAHLGFEEITYGCITLTSLPFYFNFVCIHIYPLNAYHMTTIFLSATEDVCVLDSDWTRIRKHRGHVSTNRKIPYSWVHACALTTLHVIER